jgi:hypothetical protein
MKTSSAKHFKFINSQTGNVIYYYTVGEQKSLEELKEILEKKRAHVAVQNNLFLEIIYWEEIKDE